MGFNVLEELRGMRIVSLFLYLGNFLDQEFGIDVCFFLEGLLYLLFINKWLGGFKVIFGSCRVGVGGSFQLEFFVSFCQSILIRQGFYQNLLEEKVFWFACTYIFVYIYIF